MNNSKILNQNQITFGSQNQNNIQEQRPDIKDNKDNLNYNNQFEKMNNKSLNNNMDNNQNQEYMYEVEDNNINDNNYKM